MNPPNLPRLIRLSRRHLTHRPILSQTRTLKSKPPFPYPTVPTCPSPTCTCAPTPEMPADLPIDRKARIHGLIPAYSEHVLVCTGRDDWVSKIEEEEEEEGGVEGRGNMAGELKGVFGRGGRFCDPFHNISILNSSFPPTPSSSSPPTSSAYILPSFTYIPHLTPSLITPLAKAFLLPQTLHPLHANLSPEDTSRLTADPSFRGQLRWKEVDEVIVLICGHGGRDRRCGIMGPVLRSEFGEKLTRMGLDVREGAVGVDEVRGSGVGGIGEGGEDGGGERKVGARVGLISHIGGHKFAGNAIIYIPPSMKLNGAKHPLAGCGIWYGRVEPKHVEGIISETVLGGKIVEELFRGGIDSQRNILRI